MEVHASKGAGPLNTHSSTIGRPWHIMFRACTHNFRSHKLTSKGSAFSQMNINKQRSSSHVAAIGQVLEHLGARVIVVEVIPIANTNRSLGAHKPTKDIEAARVDLRNAKKMTQADCNPFEQ